MATAEAVTVIVAPSTRMRALAFVGRVAHVGFVFTPEVEELVAEFAILLQWALRLHGLDVVNDPSVNGWRVVRRESP